MCLHFLWPPNPTAILASLLLKSYYFTVVGLCSAFSSIPLYPDSKYLFTLVWQNNTPGSVMSQGFTNIPSYFFQFLNHNLQAFQPPYSSTLILGGGGGIQSLSPVQLFSTPWTAVCQASLSFTISQSLLNLMSIELVMPSNHLILSTWSVHDQPRDQCISATWSVHISHLISAW